MPDIPAERMTLDYLKRRSEASGRTAARMQLKSSSTYLLHARVLLTDLEYYVFRGLDRPDKWVRCMMRSRFLHGRLAEKVL